MAWFGNDIGGHMAQSIINGTDKMVREPRKEYVYLVYEECHGMVGVFPDEATANAIVKDLATAYDYETKDPYLDFQFLDENVGGYPEVYWKRWEVGKSILWEEKKMIKCPNCGRTAQVKERSTVDTYGAGSQHIKHIHCECGCGTKFFHSIGYNDAGDIYHISTHKQDE